MKRIFRTILIISSCTVIVLAVIGVVSIHDHYNKIEVEPEKPRNCKSHDLRSAMWNKYTPEQIDSKYCEPKFDPLTGSLIR